MSTTTSAAPAAAKKQPKLTQAQLAHALNRLQSIHQTKIRLVSATGVGNVIDWANEKLVKEFVKDNNLPPATWGMLGSYMFAGIPMDNKLYAQINTALQSRLKKRQGTSAELTAMANKLLAKSQDEIIFSRMTAEGIPAFFERYEKALDAIVSG